MSNNTNPTRRAHVTGTDTTVEKVERYLPGCYEVVDSFPGDNGRTVVVIEGQDVAGWTMDDYVLPRLASGLHFGTEVEALPVVTVTPSSGWPETDLIYRGTVYRYQGGLRWTKEVAA